MNSITEWGSSVIVLFQNLANPIFTFIMVGITNLGAGILFIAMLPIIYWCVDEKKGFRLTIITTISLWVNGRIKELFMENRPYISNPALLISNKFPWITEAFLSTDRFSFPSGHAQTSALFYTFFASIIKKPWAWVVAIIIPLFVAFTRIFLGVHYPHDVIVGLLIGYLLIIAYLFLEIPFSKFFHKLNIKSIILFTCFIALAMNQVAIILGKNIQIVLGEYYQIDVIPAAMLMGGVLGYFFMKNKSPFHASSGTLLEKTLRMLIGFSGLLIIIVGLSYILPKEGQALYDLFRFIRYSFATFWITGLAPLTFKALGISTPMPTVVPDETPLERIEDQKSV